MTYARLEGSAFPFLKFEARNSKSETISKSKCSKFKTMLVVISFWSFEFWSLGFVSNFDIRISDFFNNTLALLSSKIKLMRSWGNSGSMGK